LFWNLSYVFIRSCIFIIPSIFIKSLKCSLNLIEKKHSHEEVTTSVLQMKLNDHEPVNPKDGFLIDDSSKWKNIIVN
jgi:hypothetical protein